MLDEVRSVCYTAASENTSIFSQEEGEFLTDVIDSFPTTQFASTNDLKKRIVTLILSGPISQDEIINGRKILESCPRLLAEMITPNRLADFVFHYWTNASRFFSSVETAANAAYGIISIFSNIHTPIPGKLSRRFAWMDKMVDRVRRVYLAREICFSGLDTPQTPPKGITQNIFSPAVEKFAQDIQRTQWAPRIHPQKSPISPPKRFLDDTNGEWIGTPPGRGLPDPSRSLSPPTRAERELVMKALLRSGMSPKRSARAADDFLAGGSPNRNALRQTIENSVVDDPGLGSIEREKLRDIRSLVAEIRQIAERHK